VLFESGNVESLKSKLEWAIAHPDSMLEFGRLGRGRARSLFAWDRIVEAYERVFTLKSAAEDTSRDHQND
jgi:glycosyltransferase involved in cell wall biosynthesis